MRHRLSPRETLVVRIFGTTTAVGGPSSDSTVGAQAAANWGCWDGGDARTAWLLQTLAVHGRSGECRLR